MTRRYGYRSRRSPFGWAYPAGAEHAKDAPYNDPPEDDMECPVCGEPLYHHGGLEVWDGVFCSEACERRAEAETLHDEDGPGGRPGGWDD